MGSDTAVARVKLAGVDEEVNSRFPLGKKTKSDTGIPVTTTPDSRIVASRPKIYLATIFTVDSLFSKNFSQVL